MIYPVVLAGGNGTRLWPMSRELYPKQFLDLVGEKTLLQETLLRLSGLEMAAPLLICNEAHRFLVAEQLRQIDLLDHNIILEPAGRNTAPAIALAAQTALPSNKDALLLVLAADHVIVDDEAFRKAVAEATPLAEAGELVTFGIVPTHPETGYGYIRRGEAQDPAFRVEQFVEKPDIATAQEYVTSGDYYWNSGMFLFRADRYLEELQVHRPDIHDPCVAAMNGTERDLDFIRVNEESFLQCPSESLDYAVMEKTSRAMMVPLDAGWNDVGSWSALWELADKDVDGNVSHGDVIQHQSKNTYVRAESTLVATVGVQDLVIVQTKDAILVAAKDQVQNVKAIVNELKANDRSEHRIHREAYRPWGKYDSIDNGSRYQVKRITVKPSAKLSVQMHHHRSEHWVVVSGTANVTIDGKTQMLTENQSVYLPVGCVHALENPGKIPLELIEVQSGPYLGEDDIVRFEDRYGRS
ncbi:mannose-1-phosphate guanylyltransferase/mannose-6-phosphate isomerase [Halomonas sp. SpR8]|uniref:mannose-1-phosphate guanylyltransferase/mannose-6-phosphate isomerase n=1 Tax=Halomonas sp. SpR8 TaxID=3050463 RepID=UPI0027E409D6|nr:mannose-1-phosphate guanylyltransferase/mannose-6-phosphate isomerase [Halomonas sp. SpR8]MDQ7727289.1 mannose-1-phosphate guanylyltransferase/mannose-6-phosphate isomerase [Halomonas sp. SpR8]